MDRDFLKWLMPKTAREWLGWAACVVVPLAFNLWLWRQVQWQKLTGVEVLLVALIFVALLRR